MDHTHTLLFFEYGDYLCNVAFTLYPLDTQRARQCKSVAAAFKASSGRDFRI